MIWKGKNIRGFLHRAVDVLFDNTNTSLSATDVQGAISEIDGKLGGVKILPLTINQDVTATYTIANNSRLVLYLISTSDNVKAEYIVSCTSTGTVSAYPVKALSGASSLTTGTNSLTITAAAAVNGFAIITLGSISA